MLAKQLIVFRLELVSCCGRRARFLPKEPPTISAAAYSIKSAFCFKSDSAVFIR